MSLEEGRRGERLAERHLKAKGYRILERNYRLKLGELDLVARDGETVVFVEVKLRAGDAFGSPSEAVGSVKRRKLVRTAQAYIQDKGLDCPMRFDVISILGETVEHITDAFGG